MKPWLQKRSMPKPPAEYAEAQARRAVDAKTQQDREHTMAVPA